MLNLHWKHFMVGDSTLSALHNTGYNTEWLHIGKLYLSTLLHAPNCWGRVARYPVQQEC